MRSLIKIVLLGMLSIVLLGTGNVARQMFDSLLKCDEIRIVQVVGRNKVALEYFEKAGAVSTDFKNLAAADIYIVALSDDAIGTVVDTLTIKNKLLVHTSGSVDINVLSSANRAGVLYPLQTFSRDREIDFKTIPVCIEALDKSDLIVLKKLAGLLTDKVYHITSEQRRFLHLAAVFVNNFVNHLYGIGYDICLQQQLPFSLLQPLLYETCEKIQQITPAVAQTGPAIRNDLKTIENHLDLINEDINKEIYSLLSTAIQNAHGKKL